MQSTTSEPIGLTVAPETIQLAPGSRFPVVLTVTNNAAIVDQFGLSVEGLEPAWFDVRQGLVSLLPGAVGILEVDVHLPEGPEALAGRHQVTLRVASREVPSVQASIDLWLEVLAVGAVQASLRPERTTLGRWGSR